ncbi:MAG TPA: hypothetical protein VGN26_22765 [Armatimonadota bacterium]|jgi:hypothetical protein
MSNAESQSTRWELETAHGIRWEVAADRRLPHEDHLEMSGQQVSVIVRYAVDEERHLDLSREVIWPTLRLKADDVRGYLRRVYGPEVGPTLYTDGRPLSPGPLRRVLFDGVLTFQHEAVDGLKVTRRLFPSADSRTVVERWTVHNQGEGVRRLELDPWLREEREGGELGRFAIEGRLCDNAPVALEPGRAWHFNLLFLAWRAEEPGAEELDIPQQDTPPAHCGAEGKDRGLGEERGRAALIARVNRCLRLVTPDPVLNRAFELAKLRAAESVFLTKMGLVHSPGGGRYYGGVWANDQAEYSGPSFPFLGEEVSQEAALNAYRIYAGAMTPAFEMLPSSFEVEGDVWFHAGGDRGDAAMVAYGASRFALARGDAGIARELWPSIQWCLEYCRRKTNAAGVVESDTDELEGRFSTGTANLSTSTLAYGALVSASDLGRALGDEEAAGDYRHRAEVLRAAIESYFGAEVEGYRTYRYHEGNTVLRAWICLPLTMGITERQEGTVRALFSPRLWTPDGLATQAGEITFWDRSTLYALRGVLAAGETEVALQHLAAYSHRRLLGDHVPYPVEAYPEGGQAHLSAESALYCRVFTEGLFGITPTGLRAFRCLPRLPHDWPSMALRGIAAFGGGLDLEVSREPKGVRIAVTRGAEVLLEGRFPEGEPVEVIVG